MTVGQVLLLVPYLIIVIVKSPKIRRDIGFWHNVYVQIKHIVLFSVKTIGYILLTLTILYVVSKYWENKF